MHLKEIGMYRRTPAGICLHGEGISLKLEFAAENSFRMWTTLREDFRREETLVVEPGEFDAPRVSVTQKDNLVMLSSGKLTASIHLAPFPGKEKN